MEDASDRGAPVTKPVGVVSTALIGNVIEDCFASASACEGQARVPLRVRVQMYVPVRVRAQVALKVCVCARTHLRIDACPGPGLGRSRVHACV